MKKREIRIANYSEETKVVASDINIKVDAPSLENINEYDSLRLLSQQELESQKIPSITTQYEVIEPAEEPKPKLKLNKVEIMKNFWSLKKVEPEDI